MCSHASCRNKGSCDQQGQAGQCNDSPGPKTGRLAVIGLGPGKREHFTLRSLQTLEESEVIIGYEGYLSLIKDFWPGRNVLASGMKKEVARCREAVKLAREGKRVALISSGDPGIYGMAGPVLEIFLREEENEDIEIEIIPGLTAVSAAAAVLGAPLMNDLAIISLSDLLTPWSVIIKRLKAAAEADFVTALYNPKSKKRTSQIMEAQSIFLDYRPKATPVGIAHNALRGEEKKVITTLEDFTKEEITMFSLVIIGNCQTFTIKDKIITPRGYDGS